MVKITVDDKVFEVNPDNNLLEEILSQQKDLPYFCWHPALGSVGSCRQCAIIEYANDEDKRGRQVMACMTSPRDGARYSIENASQFRAQAIESIMTKHPHDCPVCEEGGECHLQDMTVMSGHTYRRYDGKKLTHTNQDLGPFIGHEMNRCITCYRCVRYYKDYAGGTDFGPQASHNHTYFGRFEEGALESEFSGNLVEVCPTGVFTDKVFSKHYSRKWDLQSAPSICTGCSVGCNTNPGERYGTLRRVVNRYNDQVNGYFLCDRGRFGAGYVNSNERLVDCMSRDTHDGRPSAITAEAAAEALQKLKGQAIGIGSPRASLEANLALRDFVGTQNFYAGVSDSELALYQQVLNIYSSKAVHVASIKDIEQADAVIILGEDVTNTAARIALGLRQSVKNLGKAMAAAMEFPQWHDAAIRTLAMDKRSPLYVLSPVATRLDDVAMHVHISDVAGIARIGMALANALNPAAPAVHELSQEEASQVAGMAAALKAAKRPLVVSGTSLFSADVLAAAGNIANALGSSDKPCDLALVVPEVNSLGLTMMVGPEGKALEAAMRVGAKQAVVLENDLYRRTVNSDVTNFINGLDILAVLDHLQNKTGEAANLVLPAATFAESAGTYINYEGRAQHYYSVFKAKAPIQSSVRWLSGKATFELTEALTNVIPNGQRLLSLTPGHEFTYEGMRFPRQHHRYSGRTAMRADINVHEPKQEQDEEGIMSYSMEGVPPTKDATVFNSPWSPGWNSNQSLFKFQDHTGGKLRQSTQGVRLIDATSDQSFSASTISAHTHDGFTAVPLYQLFGSEELSARTESIDARSSSGYLALSPVDASKLGLGATDGVAIHGADSLPYLIRKSLKSGTVGVSVGLNGVDIYSYLYTGLALSKAENWVAPKTWCPQNIIISDAQAADERG
jgi:NADH-quinone oxidoreductase subunit G